MNIKGFYHIVSVIIVSLFFISCGKNMSSDPPLPIERQEALYITTDNNALVSYNPYTGNKNWEIVTSGACEGSPVFLDKKVFMLTTTGVLYSINVLNGKILRTNATTLFTKVPLAAYDKYIYVAAHDGLHCFDTTLTEIWKLNPYNGTSAPQYYNGSIYYASINEIICVNASTGVANWTTSPTTAPINSSVRVSNDIIYFGTDDYKVYAISSSSGATLWSYTTTQKVTASPVVYGGMCIVGSNDYNIYCIDTTSGALRWKYLTNDRITSSSVIYQPTNTVITGSNDFNLYAINFVNGELQWKYPSGSSIKSSPIVYKDYVYFMALDKYLYCVDARYGTTVWKKFVGFNTLSSPIIDDLSKGVHSTISGNSLY